MSSFLFQQSTTTTAHEAVDTTEDVAGRIVVVGSVNQDLTTYADRIPNIGETILGTGFTTSCGGKGANQAIAARRIHASNHVTMICKVGDDIFGHTLLENLQKEQIDVNRDSAIIKASSTSTSISTTSTKIPSGVATIIVGTARDGDNVIVVAPGANYALTSEHVAEELRRIQTHDRCPQQGKREQPKPTIVIAQLEIPYDTVKGAFKTAKGTLAGGACITILNTAPAPETTSSLQALEEIFPYVDILIPNETELRLLCPDYKKEYDNNSNSDNDSSDFSEEEVMAKHLLSSKGIGKAVIVTLGARGAMVVTTTKTTIVDAPADLPCRNEPIVDTVGAGDAFCGSLAAYLLSASVSTSSVFKQSPSSPTPSAVFDDHALSNAAIKACGFASMSVRRAGASYPLNSELPEILRVSVVGDDDDDEDDRPKQQKKNKPLVTFVTGNKEKLKEVQKILSGEGDGGGGEADLPFILTNKKVDDIPELQGHPMDIAREKCRLAAKVVQGPCLTEDTSLCFHALGDMPGPYIKWFLESCGHDGLNAMLSGFDDKTAHAETILAYTPGPTTSDRDDEEAAGVQLFVGRTDGIIVPSRGSKNFGWDAIFQPDDADGKTYGEMTKEEKNAISHRGRALAKLRAFLVKR